MLEQVLACSVLPFLLLTPPHDILLLSRGHGDLAAMAGGEDPLGFFQTRELTKPGKLIYFQVPIILFLSQI